MHCIIPAAGMGTRFGANIPKALIKINGESIISRQIRELSNLVDIRVVIGYKKELVLEEISKSNLKVDIFFNHNYKHTNVVDSVRIGATGLTNEKIMVVDGDVLFKDIHTFISDDVKVGFKKITSEEPMYATLENYEITQFSDKNGNCEWAGISIMPASIYKNDNKYVCDAVSSILPQPAKYIDAYEIDTPNDLKGAEQWIMN